MQLLTRRQGSSRVLGPPAWRLRPQDAASSTQNDQTDCKTLISSIRAAGAAAAGFWLGLWSFKRGQADPVDSMQKATYPHFGSHSTAGAAPAGGSSMACRTQPPKATQYSTKMTDKKHRVVGTKQQDGHLQPGCWGSSSRYNLSPEPAKLENNKRPCGEMPTCRPGTGAAEAGETYILDPRSTTVRNNKRLSGAMPTCGPGAGAAAAGGALLDCWGLKMAGWGSGCGPLPPPAEPGGNTLGCCWDHCWAPACCCCSWPQAACCPIGLRDGGTCRTSASGSYCQSRDFTPCRSASSAVPPSSSPDGRCVTHLKPDGP